MRSSELLRPIVKDDLTGFSFGDYHSSQFGLVRVSNGSRYSEYLSPTFKNSTVDTVGAQGTLYFGRQDTTRTFQIDLAFDSITESELRDIKEWLNNGTQALIFDERPYVQYFCTLSAAPQIKYLTFYENNVRIYKGEISVSLISYYPYGFSIDGKKFADQFMDENFDEWADASRLVNQTFYVSGVEKTYDSYDSTNKQIYVYNSGDFDTDFTLEFKYTSSAATTFTLQYNELLGAPTITFTLPIATTEKIVKFNTKLGLLYIDDVITDITFGFNKIEQGRQLLKITTSATITADSMKIAYKNKFL